MRALFLFEDQRTAVRRRLGVALTITGAIGVLGSMRRASFELGLFSWQAWCWDRHVDNSPAYCGAK